MKKHAISMALVAAAMVFGSASVGYAVDYKSYPGSMCVRWHDGETPTYLSSSRRFNPSTTRRMRLDCPAVKDQPARNIRASWIYVIDRHPSDRVCARIVAYRHSGNSVLSRLGPVRCTSTWGASTNSVKLNTGGLSNILSDMHYYFSVNPLPARYSGRDSGVVTYYVQEY